MSSSKRVVMLVVAFGALSLAAGRQLAVRVEVEPVRGGEGGTLMSVAVAVAPEDRGALGEDVMVWAELSRRGERVFRRGWALKVDDPARPLRVEAVWPPGEAVVRVDVEAAGGRAYGVWWGDVTVPELGVGERAASVAEAAVGPAGAVDAAPTLGQEATKSTPRTAEEGSEPEPTTEVQQIDAAPTLGQEVTESTPRTAEEGSEPEPTAEVQPVAVAVAGAKAIAEVTTKPRDEGPTETMSKPPAPAPGPAPPVRSAGGEVKAEAVEAALEPARDDMAAAAEKTSDGGQAPAPASQSDREVAPDETPELEPVEAPKPVRAISPADRPEPEPVPPPAMERAPETVPEGPAASGWSADDPGAGELTVVVIRNGVPVAGLGITDIDVRAARAAVPVIAVGGPETVPLVLAVAVDLGAEAAADAAWIGRMLGELASRAGGGGELLVRGAGGVDSGWGLDPAAMAKRIEVSAAGPGDDLPALVRVTLDRFADRRGRAFMLLVTDGRGGRSKSGWKAAFDAAANRGVPILVAGIWNEAIGQGLRKDLRRLGELSGGAVFYLQGAVQIEDLLDRFGVVLDASYAVRVGAEPGTTGVEVTVAGAEVSASTAVR